MNELISRTGIAENADEIDTSSPFSPKGRFSRATYWAYSAGHMCVSMIMVGVGGYLSVVPASIPLRMQATAMTAIAVIAMLVVGFIFMIRRLHDLNWSGWLSIVGMIPLIGLVILVPVMFFRGTPVSNKYGPPRPWARNHTLAALLALVFFLAAIIATIAIFAYRGYMKQTRGLQSSQSETVGSGKRVFMLPMSDVRGRL